LGFSGQSRCFRCIRPVKNDRNSWHVSAHKDRIKKGDKALLYITDPEASFYGTADIGYDVYERPDGVSCDIDIEYLFLDDPITRNVIINNLVSRESKAGNQGNNYSEG
jgi:hypothetical protein